VRDLERYSRSSDMTRFNKLRIMSYDITNFTVYVTLVTLRSPSVSIQQLKLQSKYAFRFTCNHFIAKTCKTFQNIKFKKVSNSWNDLQGHSRSFILAPFDRLHMILLERDKVNKWLENFNERPYRSGGFFTREKLIWY